MLPDFFAILAPFAVFSLWTPGPNNFMLASSGVNFGVRATVPHALGVSFGFAAMVCVVMLGAGRAIERHPHLLDAMRWIGAGLLIFIGCKIACTPAPANRPEDDAEAGAKPRKERGNEKPRRARPFTFVEASLFQWINPKAWAMTLAAAGLIAPGRNPALEAFQAAALFAALGLTSSFGWTALGGRMRKFLSRGRRLRIFNVAMGTAVAAFAVPALLS